MTQETKMRVDNNQLSLFFINTVFGGNKLFNQILTNIKNDKSTLTFKPDSKKQFTALVLYSTADLNEAYNTKYYVT